MRYVSWFEWFLFLSFSWEILAAPLDRHTDSAADAAVVSAPENARPGMERLVRALESDPVNAAWWDKAQSLLDRLTAREATQLLDGFLEGRQKQALRQLVHARFELKPDELRRAAANRLASPDTVTASQNELKRRREQDPAVRLLAQVFPLRIDQAMVQEDNLRKAIDREDEASAATGIAALIGSLDGAGKQKLADDLHDLDDQQLADAPNLQRLVQRLRWTLEERAGQPRGASAVENRFKDAVKGASDRAGSDGREFRDLLARAAQGDAAARSQLLRSYGEAGLLDFMAAHPDHPIAAQVAQALGWKDKDGKVYLDVKNGTGSETWSLGAKPEDIQQNLRDFLNARGNADHVTGLELANPSRTGRSFVAIDPKTHQPKAATPAFVVPEDAAVCRLPNQPLSREIPLQRRPNYFFRPFADSPAGSYAGTDENFLVDFGDGTTPPREYQVPGRWDPVPTPDEKYMTVPSNRRDIEGLTFFPMEAMRKPPFGKQKALYEDKDMKGVYQSLGIVGHGDGGATTYRAIVANGATLRVRDYTIKPDPSQPGGARVEAVGKEPQLLCRNLKDTELSLPMISKNGRQLAAVDVKAGVTKIYNLADDGTCTEDINLGIFTGKVDFGYDNDTITFHAFNNEKNGTEYIEVPSDERLANVYVYQRSTRQMIRITHNTDQNSVYPAFRRDGSLVYLQHPHGAAVDSPEKSKLVVVDPKRYDHALFDQFTPGDAAATDRLNRLTALGTLWAHVCSTDAENISRQSAVLNTLSLDEARCRQVVSKYWDEGKNAIFSEALPNLKAPKDDLKKLTRADLESVCTSVSAPGTAAPDAPATPPNVTPSAGRSPADIVGGCVICHDRPGFPKIPFDDPAALHSRRTTVVQPSVSLADDIKRRLREHDPRNGRMPPGEALKPGEVQALIEYLKL